MFRNKTFNRKKLLVVFTIVMLILSILVGRLVYLMIFCSEYYGKKAEDLHERERDIKAARGKIIDATGTVLATNRTVCTISVIHSQIKDPEEVIRVLTKELELEEAAVRKRVEKVSSIERVKSNVDKEVGDRIRNYGLAGVKVDEDYKRYYPYGTLASKVLGFTGGDNQGIIGLEVKYEEYLKGKSGKILTLTDARGIEMENAGERRQEPVDGYNLHVSLDYNIQMYCEQAAKKVMEAKSADGVSVIVMKPDNGEILAMVNVPEFDLNDPFTLPEMSEEAEKNKQDLLNQMWRNPCINDTYEPGSVFKIITTASAFEEGVVSLSDQFFCPGYKMVEDRRIHCHKRTGHGSEDFTQGIMNSCNPVFIELGLRLGVDNIYKYFEQFGLLSRTGIDLPGEAATIMHNKNNVGPVELATVSFGQSFQVTPIQLATTVSSLINGGKRITPHFGVAVKDDQGELIETLQYDVQEGIVSSETSQVLRTVLEKVVAEGSGKRAFIEGFSIGGKTATSQTLPRSANKYISSFLGFAPADNPQVLALVVINNPQGIYYGGTIAAPVVKEIFSNILPYLGIEKEVDPAKKEQALE
ncbi:stage V sporulation protein D (sporulation-specific penicillin-binding protein) [Eubacterium sp. 14-2]|uniref:peptidoglycan D,D-transpeptidase FtsI family protein n=1 Tax=Eubacterium sp. 14-2 TaxID=1235790 RepID=UPI000338AE8F|nr:penicillin-binding transpeptidase domain-containing protein [Eubacterium sp. 14-2]EOT25502.1 stage V sporulation protein D (sporulation-specific penicillin-binding protein) [Eubacterium sp. 14-2]